MVIRYAMNVVYKITVYVIIIKKNSIHILLLGKV